MGTNRFINFFQIIIDSIDRHDIPYVLVGGTVMPFYGNVRSTQDIDIMLMLDNIDNEIIDNWLTDLDNKGMVMSKSEILHALKVNIHSNIFDPNTFVFRVDLKRIHTHLDRLTYNYRQQVKINDRNIWINCPESQIGVKLSPGFRSETDIDDVLAIVETMALDIQRLRIFLGVTDSLQYFCELLSDYNTESSTELQKELGCMR